ncbi:hypothetical protein G6F42_028917 [Rhizopus arrhizus]|nr:hypothetical protein G6F42_028917 [Rhizopus arrhizus]
MIRVDIFTIVENVPGLGASGYVEHAKDFKSVSEEKAACAYATKDGLFVLENTRLKATFDADGQLVELIDKSSNRFSW